MYITGRCRDAIPHNPHHRQPPGKTGGTVIHCQPGFSTRAHGQTSTVYPLTLTTPRTSKTRLSLTLGCPLTLTSTSSRARGSDCHCARCTDVVFGASLEEGRRENPDPESGPGGGDGDRDREDDDRREELAAALPAAGVAPPPAVLAPVVSRVQTNVTCEVECCHLAVTQERRNIESTMKTKTC